LSDESALTMPDSSTGDTDACGSSVLVPAHPALTSATGHYA